MSDILKREQLREWLASLTESERVRIMEGFVSGVLRPGCDVTLGPAEVEDARPTDADIRAMMSMLRIRRASELPMPRR